MKEKISELLARFEADLASGKSPDELRVAYLGKNGATAELMKELRNVPVDRKKEAGQMINGLKTKLEEEIGARARALEEEALQKAISSARRYNPTLPANNDLGSYHPITLVQFLHLWASRWRNIPKSLTTTIASKHSTFRSITLHAICRIPIILRTVSF